MQILLEITPVNGADLTFGDIRTMMLTPMRLRGESLPVCSDEDLLHSALDIFVKFVLLTIEKNSTK